MNMIRLTVEETNLLSIYTGSSKRGLIETISAELPFMDADMRELATRTITKIDALTESEYAELPVYAADEV
ncbi:MAG: transposon-transfer assisting family protein [Bacteroidales bacterium]|nr:transposon-transfer assisting family protein [Bacteroidales bacterium]